MAQRPSPFRRQVRRPARVATILTTGLTLGAVAVIPVSTAAATPTAAEARSAESLGATRTAARAKGTAARRHLGTPVSKKRWHSGAWVGGHMSAERTNRWGAWRGAVNDVTLTFPEYATWKTMGDSAWHVDTFKGATGRLVYGLPLLPREAQPAQLKDVAAGRHDATFRKIARDLRTRGRGDAVVKIGWEANGSWTAYRSTTANAARYRAAWRRVAKVMATESPALVLSFEINCGSQLKGQRNRIDSLTRLYPGDDVVDLVGCSAYDWASLGATTERQWRSALRPARSPGLADVAAFARARGKGLSISEWGLASTSRGGHGDNPFYLRKMKQFFDANADILVLEMYFNEATTMGNSLWPETPQNPRAAAVYRQLW